MILYRAISNNELKIYQSGLVVMPTAESIWSNNSWSAAMVTFFGSANNALHWAAPAITKGHDVVAAFELQDDELAVKGWGIYPDLAEPINVLMMLECLACTGKCPERTKLRVREYGLPSYSKENLKLLDLMPINWAADKYASSFAKGKASLALEKSYDDVIERLANANLGNKKARQHCKTNGHRVDR